MRFKKKNGLYRPEYYMGCMGIEDQFPHQPFPALASKRSVLKGGSSGMMGGGMSEAGETPSYDNTGGTGDRTAIITVSATLQLFNGGYQGASLVNGTKDTETTCFFNSTLVAGYYIKFDFGADKTVLITEAKFYQQTTNAHGVWKWQGSQDNSEWTDIGTSFTLGGAATQTITELSGNTTEYRYYQLLGVSGSASDVPYVYEFEFKISGY